MTQRVLREGDLIARWGGEEFVIIMPGIDSQQALSTLDRVRTTLAAVHLGNHPSFTASFGVTDSHSGRSLEELIQVADAGLYKSKTSGRNQITIGDILDHTRLLSDNGHRAAKAAPAFHEAAHEEDPTSNGVGIR